MTTTHEPLPLFGDDELGPAADVDPNPEPPLEPGTEPSDSSDPADATEPQPAADTSDGTQVMPVASVSETAVGSEADVDAWLAQNSEVAHKLSTGWAPTDADADAAMAAWLAADPNASSVVDDGPIVVGAGGRVERTRAPREPLIPKWLIWALLGVFVLGAIIAASAGLFASHARVIVPTVAGLTTKAARDRVESVGLVLTVSDRRFSTLPVDTVLSQSPDSGTTTTRGSAVTVVVSGGTEEFTMPDLVGQGLALARQQLEQRGVTVQVTAQPSDQPSDTVLATNPTSGSPMHTGDTVILTVAQNTTGSTTTTASSVPFTLSGVKVTIDPSAPVEGQPDAALEVARRLQSLLEASGAVVLPTRTSAETGTAISVTARQTRAHENTPTIAIGLDVVSSGLPGLVVTYPNATVATAAAAPSLMLASQITSGIAGAGLSGRQAATGSDPVLAGLTAPYSRVTLGTTGSRDDLANFHDSNWADKVARSIYQGIGAIYGLRTNLP